MWENAWITAPSDIETPGPITTNGSIVTSLPNVVSAGRKTLPGGAHVAPACAAAYRTPPRAGRGGVRRILALAVGITDFLDDFQRFAAVERHHAGVAKRDCAFLWR